MTAHEHEAADGSEKAPQPDEGGTSSWTIVVRQFKKDRIAVSALLAIIALGAVALLSPLLANSKPILVSYQGRLFLPAFKDYLNENYPIPFDIPAWLRRTLPAVFSPKYPEITRPAWQQVPDWRAICKEIDGTGQGWYLRPPVPYYYNENSSGLKLLPGYSLCQVELPAQEGAPAVVAEFVPGRPPEQELAKLRSRLAPGEELQARIAFDPEQLAWAVLDPTQASLPMPEGWEAFEPEVAGELLAAYRSPDKERAGRVVLSWQWRERYLRAGQQLEPGPAVARRALARWREDDPQGRPLEQSEWTRVAGQEALHGWSAPSQAERERLIGPQARATDVYLLFAEDRVFCLEVSAPVARRDAAGAYAGPLQAELDDAVLGSLSVSPPSGATAVDGQQVRGRRFLRGGERLSLSGVEARFVQLAPFVLGSDSHGRCVMSRLIHGTVIAGSVGFVSVAIYVVIGVFLGALAGYYRGWVDLAISRVIEVVICFPTLFLIIMVVAFSGGTGSIYMVMVALGLIRWTGVARLVRGEILKTMSEDYVAAAKAQGLPTGRIIFRHILPNSISPVFVSASFGVAGAILMETSLSFLGFGAAPPTASWGEILKQGHEYVNENLWHLVWAPGVCIFFTVTMFNLVGEGLRDAMDPKLRK